MGVGQNIGLRKEKRTQLQHFALNSCLMFWLSHTLAFDDFALCIYVVYNITFCSNLEIFMIYLPFLFYLGPH